MLIHDSWKESRFWWILNCRRHRYVDGFNSFLSFLMIPTFATSDQELSRATTDSRGSFLIKKMMLLLFRPVRGNAVHRPRQGVDLIRNQDSEKEIQSILMILLIFVMFSRSSNGRERNFRQNEAPSAL
jgi:hypothetical protein